MREIRRELRTITTSCLIWALLAVMASLAVAQPHPFGAQDLVAMERLSDPQLSPEARRVVFVLRTTDLEANRGRTDLWQVSLADGRATQLTRHPDSDRAPRFHPDGTLFFLSTRSGSSQVWSVRDGGEPQQITDLPVDVTELLVAPNGKRLAFTAEVFQDCDTLQCTADRLENRDAQGSGRVYDSLFVRHWDSWSDGRRSQLFVLELEGGKSPIALTEDVVLDVPSKPFGGAEEITFTPDSEHIVFAARRGDESEAWSTNFDLWFVPVSGETAPVAITGDNLAWDTQPVFSPDGRTLAWLAMNRAGYESDRFRIRLGELRGGGLVNVRTLTESWDRSVSSLTFSPDGKSLLALAMDLGQKSVFSVDVASGDVRRVLSDGTVSWAGLSSDRLVVAHNDLGSPTELYTLPARASEADKSALEKLTHLNDERLRDVERGEWEQFTFGGWRSEPVHGFVVRPVGFTAGQKYPVAFLIHGGPQGSFSNQFHYRWNPQVYAGAGYAVVMIDFHGSVGYGQAFTDSIRADWGGKPLEDLKSGLTAALGRYPYLDGDRVCALGASYGGYMINWMAGNWSDPFRCFVNHDGVFDQRSMYYATEELWFPEWENYGAYFTSAEAYEKHNPVRFVDRWQTPMLVIHGALDFRVPETQGLAAFTALKRRGVPSRLLYFPDENHWVQKPRNSLQWHHEVLAWLSQWLEE